MHQHGVCSRSQSLDLVRAVLASFRRLFGATDSNAGVMEQVQGGFESYRSAQAAGDRPEIPR